jgi:hypothetical protein
MKNTINIFPINLNVNDFTRNDVKIIHHLVCKNMEIYIFNIDNINKSFNKNEFSQNLYLNKNKLIVLYKQIIANNLTLTQKYHEELKLSFNNLDI